MKFASWRPRRDWTGAILALLVGGWLAPAPVRAGCGDYVAIPGENHPMPEKVEPSRNIPDQRQPFSPCTSAACVPPSDMALAPATSLGGGIDQLAWGNSPLSLFQARQGILPIPGDFQGSQGPPVSIFHPPRALTA